MKSLFTIFLVFSFVGIAVFGVFAMNHGGAHGHAGCLAVMTHGTVCPGTQDTNAFLNFHLDAFKSFSTATFGNDLASALILLLVLIATAGFGIIAAIQLMPPICAVNQRRRKFLESYSFPLQRELISWFALHENSPSIL